MDMGGRDSRDEDGKVGHDHTLKARLHRESSRNL